MKSEAVLEQFWGSYEAVLGSSGTILKQFRDSSGTVPGQFQDSSGTVLEQFWSSSGAMKFAAVWNSLTNLKQLG